MLTVHAGTGWPESRSLTTPVTRMVQPRSIDAAARDSMRRVGFMVQRTHTSVIVHAVPPGPGIGQSVSRPFEPQPSPCSPSACFPQIDGAGQSEVLYLHPTHVRPICAALKH